MNRQDRLRQIYFEARAITGTARELYAWVRCQRVVLPNVQKLAESIAALQAGRPSSPNVEEDTEAPIFLLSTGWRTGSTLLQRILVTDSRLLLWGEPLGRMALVPRVTEMLSGLSEDWPPSDYWIRDTMETESLPQSWIANLFPPGEDFKAGLRQFCDRWLGTPAYQRGFTHWGLKEVRLSATDASLLHWLYPRAKFIVLTRHPYDCYRSATDSARGWGFYYRWPDVRIDSAAAFASHWNRLATSWLDIPESFPWYRIRYEDLISGKVDFRELGSWLDLDINENLALSTRVGSSAKRERIAWHERFIIDREAAAGMRMFGYGPSSDES